MANYNGKYYIYNKNGNDNFLKALKKRETRGLSDQSNVALNKSRI